MPNCSDMPKSSTIDASEWNTVSGGHRCHATECAMDGGYAPRVAAPRVRRGTRMLAFVASSLLGVAASRALADDPAALRPLAKRYADPRQLFDTEENDMQFKQVVDTQKTFRVPPRPAPTIRFAMEEPPAFVMG